MPGVAKNKNRNAFRGRTNHTDRDCNFTERDTGAGGEVINRIILQTAETLIILSKVRIIVAWFCDGGTRMCSGNTCATHVWAKTHPIAVWSRRLHSKNEMTRQTTGQMYNPDQNDF